MRGDALTKPVIYQLVVRYFGNTNTTNRRDGTIKQNGCGKFADISDAALAALREMGVTHVWLTGCIRQATLTDWSRIGLPPDDPDVVKGIAGSFYAIRDYFDVSPDYAVEPEKRLEEFDALVQRVHSAGMKALIDFVPNHVARGYKSVVRPELSFGEGDDTSVFFARDNHFFYLVDPPGQALRLDRPPHWTPPLPLVFDGKFELEDGSAGRPPKATGNNVIAAAPGWDGWYETVKLNYGFNFVDGSAHYTPAPRTWLLMDEVLAYWQARGVDGFRCDFAHYVPPQAWAYLIAHARSRDDDSFFFAEAYPWVGSGDPITDRLQLTAAGFDAVYDDDTYNALKRIYQGHGSQDEYSSIVVGLPEETRCTAVRYLENHDERRVASPVDPKRGHGESGFGSMHAGYLLAPLQYLISPGPVMLLNGQEVGEPAAGWEGFGGDDGRTTLFDYWCMPEHAKWVNGHRYDGGGLGEEQRRLRAWYADLLAVCQDESVRASGYWGLKYWNRPDRFGHCPDAFYSFARFADGSERMVLVVGNFDRGASRTGRVRVPRELAEVVNLKGKLTVRLRLDRAGAADKVAAKLTRDALVESGFEATVPAETAHVYVIQ